MEIGEQRTLNVTLHVLRGVSLLVAAVAVAGCSSSGPKQEFTVPRSLCGVSVPTGALSRLLPTSGKELAAQQTNDLDDDGHALCVVKVDGVMVLAVSGERITVGDSARGILLDQLSVSQQKYAANGSIAYTDWAAVSLTKCRGADVEEEDISVLIKVLKPARHDESAMKELISGYTSSLEKQQPCIKRTQS